MSDKEIVERLFRGVYVGRVFLTTAIARILTTSGVDPIDAEGQAEQRQVRIWNRVVLRLGEEIDKGLSPTFEIVDEPRLELAWYASPRSADASKLRLRKHRLTRRGPVIAGLDGLSDRDYEALGCLACISAGASKYLLTPRGNDRGIDFIANVPAYGLAHLFPSPRNALRIVGQSKKWARPTTKDAVRLLASTILDIQRQNSDILSQLPAWFLASNEPIVGCIFSHSGFQSGATSFALQHGMVLGDTRDLAEIMCTARRYEAKLSAPELLTSIRSDIAAIVAAA